MRGPRMVILAALVMLMVGSVGTASAAVVVKERYQDILYDFNTCNGEPVVLQGTIHIVQKIDYHIENTC